MYVCTTNIENVNFIIVPYYTLNGGGGVCLIKLNFIEISANEISIFHLNCFIFLHIDKSNNSVAPIVFKYKIKILFTYLSLFFYFCVIFNCSSKRNKSIEDYFDKFNLKN